MTAALHISDPHFGTQQEPVLAALRELVAWRQPEVVLLGGDITQRARAPQFLAARRYMDSLGRPFLAVPGNHDIPLFNLFARLFDPYGNYRRAFGADREPVYESEGLLVIGVDSTRRYRHKHGEISPAQVRRVAHRLRQAGPAQLRVVLLHHPLVAAVAQDRPNLARGREAAVAEWTRAGADILLGGHIHLPYVTPLAPSTPAVTPPGQGGARGALAWAVQAGTALSHRVRGGVPNSVNVLDWRWRAGQARVCRVERWDFLAASGRFEPAAEHELALGERAARRAVSSGRDGRGMLQRS
ncbi:metallophosphoesterase [Orrella sp. JC864]|uniref:metallophosphoesterase family protein n=1 Tax=Orrella sp. JC864 TaxID=3120298 RepID=UPI0030096C40